jgi:hypothetical protein
LANLYAVKRVEGGRTLLPQKHGPNGWYGYTANQYFDVQRDLYLWSMNEADLTHLGADPWLNFYAEKIPAIRRRRWRGTLNGCGAAWPPCAPTNRAQRTRPSDGAQRFAPVATETLVNLMLGGNDPGSSGDILHARLRYFDPARRRAGLLEDVAALVTKLTAETATVVLVNTNPLRKRTVSMQLGAFGEHEGAYVEAGGKRTAVTGPLVTVELAAAGRAAGDRHEALRQPAAGRDALGGSGGAPRLCLALGRRRLPSKMLDHYWSRSGQPDPGGVGKWRGRINYRRGPGAAGALRTEHAAGGVAVLDAAAFCRGSSGVRCC